MIYTLDKIAPKDYEGNIVFLYGDETAERTLPLGKKEIALVKERREEGREEGGCRGAGGIEAESDGFAEAV